MTKQKNRSVRLDSDDMSALEKAGVKVGEPEFVTKGEGSSSLVIPPIGEQVQSFLSRPPHLRGEVFNPLVVGRR